MHHVALLILTSIRVRTHLIGVVPLLAITIPVYLSLGIGDRRKCNVRRDYDLRTTLHSGHGISSYQYRDVDSVLVQLL